MCEMSSSLEARRCTSPAHVEVLTSPPRIAGSPQRCDRYHWRGAEIKNLLPGRVHIGWTDERYSAPQYDTWVIKSDYPTHLAPFGSRSFDFPNSKVMPPSGPAHKIHDYHRGNSVDVLDVYFGSSTGKVTKKWRRAVVRSYTTSRVFVSYVGFAHYWDEWIDLTVDAARVKYVPCCLHMFATLWLLA